MQPNQRLTMGLVALLTGLLGLGWLGIHKFVMGYSKEGIITILVSILTCGLFGTILSIIEGVIYLTMSDEKWYETYIVGKKAWL